MSDEVKKKQNLLLGPEDAIPEGYKGIRIPQLDALSLWLGILNATAMWQHEGKWSVEESHDFLKLVEKGYIMSMMGMMDMLHIHDFDATAAFAVEGTVGKEGVIPLETNPDRDTGVIEGTNVKFDLKNWKSDKKGN